MCPCLQCLYRRVFNPIRIDMRHSKVPSAAARAQLALVRRASTPMVGGQGGGQGGGQVARGEELVFKVRPFCCASAAILSASVVKQFAACNWGRDLPAILHLRPLLSNHLCWLPML